MRAYPEDVSGKESDDVKVDGSLVRLDIVRCGPFYQNLASSVLRKSLVSAESFVEPGASLRQ